MNTLMVAELLGYRQFKSLTTLSNQCSDPMQLAIMCYKYQMRLFLAQLFSSC